MFSQDDLVTALSVCFIPSLRRDVVAAGLVRSARVEVDREAPGAGIAGVPDRYRVHVTLSALGSDDAVNAQTSAAVENRLLGLPEVARAEVVMLPALFPILQASKRA